MTPREAAGLVLETVLKTAAPLGVRHWGVCALGDLSGLLPARGRQEVSLLAQGGGSAIVLLLPYYAGEFRGRNLSRHALANDYHTVALAILSKVVTALEEALPQARFVPLVDSSPIPEVEAAVLAGLGARGRNGLLLTPWYGSMAFVCEIATDLALTAAAGTPWGEDPCRDCGFCVAACPTGALGSGGVDRARCRSHITQKKGGLTPWEEAELAAGGLAWGCDICIDSCPHNRGLPLTPVAALREDIVPVLTVENLDPLLGRKSYGWRGRETLLRNLRIIGEER